MLRPSLGETCFESSGLLAFICVAVDRRLEFAGKLEGRDDEDAVRQLAERLVIPVARTG